MPYLGNTPSTSFATVVKDSFSGDGSTVAFTLSKVATTNSVSVFVENVRQEPTTAYAVSGTTLTFTAAPVTSSGNNIYVLHMNPTTTTTHPAAQALTATSGTFTGAFTSLGIDDNADATAMTIDSSELVGIGTSTPSSYNQYGNGLVVKNASVGSDNSGISVVSGTGAYGSLFFSDGTGNSLAGGAIQYNHSSNFMELYTNDELGMKIDANGHVTMPKQPCFQARPSSKISNIAVGSSQTLAMATEAFDLNADYDHTNSNFTAPVAGKYLLTLNLRVESLDIDGSYFQAIILTSNKEYQSIISTNRFSADPSYMVVIVSVVADMDASDTAIPRVFIASNSAAQVDVETESYFSGCLLA